MGFGKSYPVTGQTYSRKVDAQVLASLSGIGQSAHKAGTDLRILQSRKEIDEPFETKQIGSSAMAYKRNPMRSERMCALSRFAINLPANAEQTTATQWMERTLDDSANRRLALPQAFLAIDAVLILYRNIVDGLVVHPKVIEKNLRDELSFMATEEILMAGVRAGGDRQLLHERIRVHSQEAARRVKDEGESNDLIERLKGDPAFAGRRSARGPRCPPIHRPRPAAGRHLHPGSDRADSRQIQLRPDGRNGSRARLKLGQRDSLAVNAERDSFPVKRLSREPGAFAHGLDDLVDLGVRQSGDKTLRGLPGDRIDLDELEGSAAGDNFVESVAKGGNFRRAAAGRREFA